MLGWMWKGLTGLFAVDPEEIGVEIDDVGLGGTVSPGPSREEISANKIKELTGSNNLEGIKKILSSLDAFEESKAVRLFGSLKEKLGGEGMEKFSPLTRVLDSYLRKTEPKETGKFVQALVDEITWGLVTEFMQINSGDEDYLKNLVAFVKRINDKLDVDLSPNILLIYESLLDQTQTKIYDITSGKIGALNGSSNLGDIKSILEGIASLDDDKAAQLLGSLKIKLGGEGMEKFVPLSNLFETFLARQDRKKCAEFIENILQDNYLEFFVNKFAKIDKISKNLDELVKRLRSFTLDTDLQTIQGTLSEMGFKQIVSDVEELSKAGTVSTKYADQVAVKTLGEICDGLKSKLSQLNESGSVGQLKSNLLELKEGIEEYRHSLNYLWDLFVNAITLGKYGQRASEMATDQAAINSLLGVLEPKFEIIQNVEPQEKSQSGETTSRTISSLQKRYSSWIEPKNEIDDEKGSTPAPG